MRKLKLFLKGRFFKLVVDHWPLLGIIPKPLAQHSNSRLANLCSKIIDFTFEIEWQAG
jgi:hypothetical protein